MTDLKTKKEKRWIYLIFFALSILFSIFSPNPANAAAGDLILNTEILFSYPDPHEATTLGTTLLKEGYSLSLDDVYDICCQDRTAVGLTIYKNEDIVKTIKVKTGDYIYYNKTIGGREYTIIESKFDAHFLGIGDNIGRLKPFYQYSDGSTIIEPDFITTNLNPKIKEAPSEEWNRTFGRMYVWSVQQTLDDGYILGGTIGAQNPEAEFQCFRGCGWLIKVDVNGNEQWNKTFGDFGYISSVLHLDDGGYIFLGIKFTSTGMPTVLVKTDVNGNQQWTKSFLDLEEAHSIQQTSDGGFILAGKSRLVKTDSNGNEQWSKTFRLFGVGGFYTTSSVQETQDGGYILAGEEAWISKTDSNGTEQWSRTFGGAGYDSVNSVQNTLDGGYIFAGRTGKFGTGSDAWLLKTDANGNEQWDKTFGLDGFDSVYSVVQTSDGGYVLAGTIDTAKNSDFKGQILYEDLDAWLFKTDASGNLEWSKTIGKLKRDEARFVQQTKDGGYVIAGNTESDGSGGSDAWLVKVADLKVNTTQSQVIISDYNFTDNNISDYNVTDYNVTDNTQTSPGKSTPGFEFFGGVFSILIILFFSKKM